MTVIPSVKNVAIVAHDHRKEAIMKWATKQHKVLTQHELFATGTTGQLLEKVLGKKIHKFKSGPIGGDQQIGAAIAEGKIHVLIFFWDPFEALPHDPDVKALLRLATVWNIPLACNETTADFLLECPSFSKEIQRDLDQLRKYDSRDISDIITLSEGHEK